MTVHYAAPCVVCGRLYLRGSDNTCGSCLQRINGGSHRQRKPARLRCDCGKWAEAVVIVRVGTKEDGFTKERLPLCPQCLEVEKKIQAMLDRLGYG